MYVPAHTSKIGYFENIEKSIYNVRFRSTWTPEIYDIVRSTSYKSPTIGSDGRKATDYCRKVSRIDSIQGPNYQWEPGSDGYLFRRERKGDLGMSGWYGLGMTSSFWGNSVANYGVSVPSWMTDKVIQDAIIELKEFETNILEDLGQANQTLGMLWGILRTIVDLYKFATRGDVKSLRRAFKRYGTNVPQRISNAWLMYFYGIKPLIGTFEALTQTHLPRDKTRTVKRSVTDPLDPKGAIIQGLPGWLVTSSGDASRGASCILSVTVSMSSDLSYWKSLGLSGDPFNDAITTAWALVPYSFVIDWVLPVERFLRSRSWGSGIKYQSGSVSKRINSVTIHHLHDVQSAIGDKPKVLVRCMMFERAAYNSFVPPSGLSLRLSLTSTQAFNALALILQRR